MCVNRLIAFLVIGCFIGCSHYTLPTAHPTTVLEERGEVHISASNKDLQVQWSPLSKWYVQGAGFYSFRPSGKGDSWLRTDLYLPERIAMGEIGVGRIFHLGNDVKYKPINLAVNYAYGQMYIGGSPWFMDFRTHRFSLNANMEVVDVKYFKLIPSLRLSLYQHSNYNLSDNYLTPEDGNLHQEYSEINGVLFQQVELGLTARGGVENLQAFLQIQGIASAPNYLFSPELPFYNMGIIRGGITLNTALFSNLFSKENTSEELE